MIGKDSYNLILILLFSLITFSVNSQTRKELEVQRKKLKTEINRVNKLLFTTQKSEKYALDDLRDLNQRIGIRRNFIKSINEETALLSTEIKRNQKKINLLSNELKVLKKDYAAMIFKSYKSKSKQRIIMFLLSSNSFQQAYKRIQYMKQYTLFRKKQGKQISLQAVSIQRLNDSLLFKKQEKDTLILIEKEQKRKIEYEKKRKVILVSKIKKKEKKYIREIKRKQKEEQKITAKIDKIIRDAIAKSNLKKGKKTSKRFVLASEAKALAVKFEENKGKLPWPVDNGLIVRRYGKQAHPSLKGITITSTGLHIATDKGENAKSVFNGKVLAIQLLSGGKKAVLVQHGNYITTYNNLESLFVKTGDLIKTGQHIGKIFTNKITGKTVLIFVLHKETKRQNPANWIVKNRF